jgi:hypothetical protein
MKTNNITSLAGNGEKCLMEVVRELLEYHVPVENNIFSLVSNQRGFSASIVCAQILSR